METTLRVAEAAVVGVHYLFLAYLIVGGFLARRRPRTIWLHLLAAVWGAVIVSVGAPCPLTTLQNWLRGERGEPPLRTGFIRHYVTGTFYPAGAERPAQLLVGAVVVWSWLSFVRVRRRQASASRPDVTASASATTSGEALSDQ